MSARTLRDSVERWLVHEGLSFKDAKTDDDIFRIEIKHVGSFGNSVEIFEPSGQPGVLVLGSTCPLKNNQNARYLKLTEKERKIFMERIAEYCQSIRAVHRLLDDDGKKAIGVYIVLDKKEQINHEGFSSAVRDVTDMGDSMSRHMTRLL